VFSISRSSIKRLPATAMFVSLGVFILLVLVGGSTASATLNDGDVVLGAAPNNVCTPGTNANCTSSLTGIVNTASGGDAFHGFSDSGTGVGGFSNTGEGVKGQTGGFGDGVFGNNAGPGAGVSGASNSGDGVIGQGSVGVEGFSNFSSGQAEIVAGVFGRDTSSGTGVYGFSGSGTGVYGETPGPGKAGVQGTAIGASSIGVQATNGGHAGATALKASGKTSFSRSGTLTVSAGTSSATKSPISLGSGSLVLTTIQGNQPGVYVQGVTKVTGTSGSFTIHLSKNTSGSLPVAWFVIN
jgi:hypothetical protein